MVWNVHLNATGLWHSNAALALSSRWTASSQQELLQRCQLEAEREALGELRLQMA